MRALAVALSVGLLAVPAAAARSPAVKVVYLQGKTAVIVYLGSAIRQPIPLSTKGTPGWSGDGRLVSVGGTIIGRARLPTTQISWAPTGERAAFVTRGGGVRIWTPGGQEQVTPDGWGATSLAWGSNGMLALGRSVCHAPCGTPRHQEIWTWRQSLRRVVGPLQGVQRPIVSGFDPRGRVLWWPDEQGSASLAADGLVLHANNSPLVRTLAFRDYVARCGRHLALAAGGDRTTTHAKRILFDGVDVSRDPSRAWVSPTCNANGVLLAAAGRNWEEDRFGREHRSIWKLLPVRRRLTHPPAGWTDELPRLLSNGSVVFIRTRQTARKRDGQWFTTSRGRIELLTPGGTLSQIAALTFTERDESGPWLNYYGHYDWPSQLAVSGS
jgi:hypothetical protein